MTWTAKTVLDDDVPDTENLVVVWSQYNGEPGKFRSGWQIAFSPRTARTVLYVCVTRISLYWLEFEFELELIAERRDLMEKYCVCVCVFVSEKKRNTNEEDKKKRI